MENQSKFPEVHGKNRADFQNFIKKVIDKDTEQEGKEPRPND